MPPEDPTNDANFSEYVSNYSKPESAINRLEAGKEATEQASAVKSTRLSQSNINRERPKPLIIKTSKVQRQTKYDGLST